MVKINYKLPKKTVLNRPEDFSAVFRGKASCSDGNMLLYGMPNSLAYSRFGISIGRKYGNAYRRNRCKRCVREAYRLLANTLPTGYDWVIVPRPSDKVSTKAYISSFESLTARVIKRINKKQLGK